MKTFEDFGINVSGYGEKQTQCPKCSHERKKKAARCLSVNTDKGVWVCHHCGWTGTLKGGNGRCNANHYQKPKYRLPTMEKVSELPDAVVGWFKLRGIGIQTLVDYNIGYGSIYMPQIEGETTAIRFPYYRGDTLINIKYRDGQKNFRLAANAEKILYGLNDMAKTTIIVEGEIDKLSFASAGFKNCVSVPTGAPSPASNAYASEFSYLVADQDEIEAVDQWVIAVDSDEAGKKLEFELARRLGREKCRHITWPEDAKDANECLLKYGKDKLGELVADAPHYPVSGIYTIGDISDAIDNLYLYGLEKGFTTGWSNVDAIYTVRPSELCVVTGIPNSGKSDWIDNLMVNLAKSQGWTFGVFSPENQPLEDHAARIIEKWADTAFDKSVLDAETLEVAKQWVSEHFNWILPDDDAEWTLDNILTNAKILIYRKGIRGLIIDPWNEMEHERPGKMSETEFVGLTLKRLRQFARQYSIAIWVVAHPAKLYPDKEGNTPIPTPYSISGSAHWRNKSDVNITVHRHFDDPSKDVEIYVHKCRFKQIGRIGMAKLVYNRSTSTYGDSDD